MNSEKVKEIKELLLRKAKEYESQTLLEILTLINELESENERLNKALVDNLEAYKDGFNEGAGLKKGFDNKLKTENQKLKYRIAELEDDKEKWQRKAVNYYQMAKSYGIECIIDNDIDETLKEFIK